MPAANVGTSLSKAQSVLVLCPLTELSTCGQVEIKIFIASAILRDTVITYSTERFAWDSQSEIATAMGTLTATQDGIQYPGSLLKKFLNGKLKKNCRLK